MRIFFSASAGTFYNDALHNDIPQDAQEISEAAHREIREKLAQGWQLQVRPDGSPVAAPPSDAELAARAHFEAQGKINAACEHAIVACFQSAALGAPHQYSCQLDDQLNLTGAILRGLDMPYACRDERGVKAFRVHTAAQLRQVGDDFTLYKLQQLQHANELKQQLDLALTAGDTAAMAQIRWEAEQP